MKFSAVKRQLLDDQVESAKCLLSYAAEIESKGELDINPYLKSEMGHLQKYVDQLSVKPRSPHGLYRRTEEEDLSYCLHKKHSKSMKTIKDLMEVINKELHRLKKLKQAEKKLEFLELFQSRDQEHAEDFAQLVRGNRASANSNQIAAPKTNQYKLPGSKGPIIPQLASPKPKYEPVSLQTEEEIPEMSRAMEGFLKQQEKERKEKEMKQQQQQQKEKEKEKEIKPISAYIPTISSSDMKEGEKANSRQEEANKSGVTPNTVILKENPLISSDESKVDSVNEKKTTNSSPQPNRTLNFSALRQSGPTNKSPRSLLYTSSDPERPYGAYSNENCYASTLGRSSGTTLENQTKSVEDKSRGAYY